MMNLPFSSEKILFWIDSYPILKKLGAGGIGEVFLTYDPSQHCYVALKRLHLNLQKNEEKRVQFICEAHLTRQLKHKSIVSVYKIVEKGDQTYYTMSYIEGENLREILNKKRQQEISGFTSWEREDLLFLLHIFIQVCEVMDYAHSQKIIHRDLKPSNIIIKSSQEVFVLDWGVATHEESLPSNSTVSGTILYLAPETLLRHSLTIQTEIYALGLILYEMLTLRYPFHRNNLKEYFQNLQKEALVNPKIVSPYHGISNQLSRLVLKCLEENPEERYQAVFELLKDLKTSIKELEDNHFHPPSKKEIKNAIQTPTYSAPPESFLQSLYEQIIEEFSTEKPYNDFFLLGLCYLRPPKYVLGTVIDKVKNQLKPIYFIDPSELTNSSEWIQQQSMAIHMAFLMQKAHVLDEILIELFNHPPSPLPLIEQALMALIELGNWKIAEEKINHLSQQFLDIQTIAHLKWISEVINHEKKQIDEISFLNELPKRLSPPNLRPLLYLLTKGIQRQSISYIQDVLKKLLYHHFIPFTYQQTLIRLLIRTALYQKDAKLTKEYLDLHSTEEECNREYQFLRDCWLMLKKEKMILPPILYAAESSWWEKKQWNIDNHLFLHVS